MENAYGADVDLPAWENLTCSHGQPGPQQDILRRRPLMCQRI